MPASLGKGAATGRDRGQVSAHLCRGPGRCWQLAQLLAAVLAGGGSELSRSDRWSQTAWLPIPSHTGLSWFTEQGATLFFLTPTALVAWHLQGPFSTLVKDIESGERIANLLGETLVEFECGNMILALEKPLWFQTLGSERQISHKEPKCLVTN